MGFTFYNHLDLHYCYNVKHESLTTYRVDRMERVCTEEEPVCPQAVLENGDIHAYTSQVFKMFNGVPEELTITFADTLIGAMYDRFGEEIEIQRVDEKTCCVTVTVQDSPVFRGWLAQFGDQVSIAKE